jgi:hypothetical protein
MLRHQCLFSTTSSNEIDEYDDFAEFSSPQIISTKSSSSSLNDFGEGVTATNNNNSNNIDDSLFFSSLQLRMQQLQAITNTLPLIILDTMLPRQVLQIQIQHPTLKSLIKHRAVTMETPTLGMLGMAKLSNTPGAQAVVPLKIGVEVEIIDMDKAQATLEGSIGDELPWDVTLRATERRFVIAGNVTKMESGWTEANVKFLTSAMEEEEEIHPGSSSSSSIDRMSVARAISKSRQFTEPNMNMTNNASLIARWIELAKLNERIPGQIDKLLQQLGDIPPEYEPSERAFWVGALINPLPGMGVAMEIRPALLLSKRAEERVQIALDGILKSIRHMDGTSRMW